MVKKATKTLSVEQIKALRKSKNMNQGEFWSRLCVTQSGGSRYESGRKVPTSTMMLMQIAYGTEAQANVIVEALRSKA